VEAGEEETTAMTAPMRALLSFAAAVISLLTFHQGTWALLHAAGLMPPAPYPTDAVPPLGVPRIVNFCFWGGLYGLVFGCARQSWRGPAGGSPAR
jgi:apolipoprotein N-acyltransferase